MEIAAEEAAPILEELIARAEAVEDIIFTLDGRAAARLVVATVR